MTTKSKPVRGPAMSETRRMVSVEIVYDGDHCSHNCQFLSGARIGYAYCERFGSMALNRYGDKIERCEECKAEDYSADLPSMLTAEQIEAMRVADEKARNVAASCFEIIFGKGRG